MNTVVLRRVSWMVFAWAGILGLGIGMALAVFKATSVDGFRTGWQGIPVYLAFAGYLGRFASCKVVLRGDVLTVVNPLRSHILPRETIRYALVGDDGALEVHLHKDRVVGVYAFGGSLIDHFVGSSGKAERKIRLWLGPDRTETGSEAVAPQVRWTWCPIADATLVLSAVLAAVGAIWMAFTGS